MDDYDKEFPRWAGSCLAIAEDANDLLDERPVAEADATLFKALVDDRSILTETDTEQGQEAGCLPLPLLVIRTSFIRHGDGCRRLRRPPDKMERQVDGTPTPLCDSPNTSPKPRVPLAIRRRRRQTMAGPCNIPTEIATK